MWNEPTALVAVVVILITLAVIGLVGLYGGRSPTPAVAGLGTGDGPGAGGTTGRTDAVSGRAGPRTHPDPVHGGGASSRSTPSTYFAPECRDAVAAGRAAGLLDGLLRRPGPPRWGRSGPAL